MDQEPPSLQERQKLQNLSCPPLSQMHMTASQIKPGCLLPHEAVQLGWLSLHWQVVLMQSALLQQLPEVMFAVNLPMVTSC